MTGRQAYCHALVLRLFRWTEERHAEMVYAEGLRYLDLYMGDDPKSHRVLEGMEQYWNWWKAQWNALTVQWVREFQAEKASLPDARTRAMLQRTYEAAHNSASLCADKGLRISRDVMQEVAAIHRQQWPAK